MRDRDLLKHHSPDEIANNMKNYVSDLMTLQ